MEETENMYKMQNNNRKYITETIKMAWPAVLESVATSIAGIIDTFMVSTIDANAVAAVGLTVQPKFLGLCFFIALSVAVSALTARRKGENRREDANRILIASIVITIIAAFIISIVFVAYADPIIRISGSTKETHKDAVLYFRIIMGCMFFTVFTLIVNSAQRGVGNTKIAMSTNLVSTGVNIVLNYILINGNLGFPALGIKGAAIATVTGTIISSIMCIISISKDGFLSIKECIKNKIYTTKETFISIWKLGYSVFIEQLLLRVGFMLVGIMAARQGNNDMAAHQVAMNFMSLAFSFGDGMQSAAVSLIGQSLGRKNIQDAKKYRYISQKIGFCISIILFMVFTIFGRFIFKLYFKNEEIIDIGVKMMFILAFITTFQIIQIINSGCLRGAGDVKYVTMVSTVCVTFVRPIAAYIFCYVAGFGIIGIWIGIFLQQSLQMVLTSLHFRNDNWTSIKI